MDFVSITGNTNEKIEKLKALGIQNELFCEGVKELEMVVGYVRAFGVPDTNFKVDLTIARGLDYYTGIVYETFLNNYREIGSICSGGRYDNLADYYTDRKLPGVGVSMGLSRLFYKLDELNIIQAQKSSIAEILVIPMIEDKTEALKVAAELREAGIPTQVYLEDKKIKAQFKYADKLQVPYTVVVGEEEVLQEKYTLKDMATGEQEMISIEEIVKKVSN